MNKIMKTVFGSHLYGLDTPDSDKDYKGIYLPTLEELLLNTYKPRINLDTNKKGKNSSDDVDMEWIALPEFIRLACKGESEALDMLHSDVAELYEYGRIWEDLRYHRHCFYTKGLKSYMGMLKGQVIKNHHRGDKLKEIRELIIWADARDALGMRLMDIWNRLPAGKNFQFVTDDNGEEFYQVHKSRFQKTITIDYFITQLRHLESKYGERTRKTAAQGYDWKAISHALRVGYQLHEIYVHNDFHYPLPETEYLAEVKAGKHDYETEVQPSLEALIGSLDALAETSNLPERTDREFWNKWLLKQYNNQYTLGEMW